MYLKLLSSACVNFDICTDQSLAVQTLNWNSHHIDDYIMEVMALVRDVNETLTTIKGNVKRTSEVLAGWVANPMFDRKEGKVSTISQSPNCTFIKSSCFPMSAMARVARSCSYRSKVIIRLSCCVKHLVLVSNT